MRYDTHSVDSRYDMALMQSLKDVCSNGLVLLGLAQ